LSALLILLITAHLSLATRGPVAACLSLVADSLAGSL